MTDYVPPLRDIRYVLDEMSGFPQLLDSDRFGHVDQDMVRPAMLDPAGKLADHAVTTRTSACADCR